MLLIIGFLFMIFVFALTTPVMGMLLTQTVDVPSSLMLIVPLFFFLILSKSGSVIGRYIKTSFTKDYVYTKTELKKLCTAIKNTVKFLLGTGGVGFLLGMIATLMNLEVREMLGPNIAVSLFTVLYSISASFFVFFPAQAWAENKINTLKDDV